MSVQHVAAPPSPYKGLAPFEDSSLDALFFFGRERESEIVSANLLAYRLTVLYGASGVGKSSLLGAGVAHRLRRQGEAVAVFDTWSGDAVTSLVAEVRETLDATVPDDSADSLAGALGLWTASLGQELYLILDQFDEYFLYHQHEDDFAHELAEVVTRPGLRINILISIRDDMLARLDRFKALIPNLFSNYLRLDHLDRRAAREAIVRPVERYNTLVPPTERVAAEPELVEAVLDQTIAARRDSDESADRNRVEAPYLQLVMQRLWEEERSRGSQILRLETLDRLGGSAEIVRTHLVEALEALPPDDRDVAAKLFNHLVTPSGTKIAHDVGDLAQYASLTERDVAPVLAALADERIVRPVTAPGGPEARYEIFHDVLAEPVVAWRHTYEAERELERTRVDVRRRHRRLLVLAAVALLAVAVMVGVTVYALTQRSNAAAQAQRAHARELAANALIDLQSHPQASLQLVVQAAQLLPSPEIEVTLRRVLVESHERVVLTQDAPVRAVAYSPRGHRFATGGRDGSVHVYTAAGRPLRTLVTGGAIRSIDYSEDGRVAAAASGDGTVRLLDGRSGRQLRVLRAPGATSMDFGGNLLVVAGADGIAYVWRANGEPVSLLRNPGAVLVARLSNDDRYVVTVARDQGGVRQARIFDTRSGELRHVLPQLDITTADFSPYSTIVATGSADGSADLWDVRSGRPLHRLETGKAVVDLDFSRDGKWLATASANDLGHIWEVATGAHVHTLVGPTLPLTSIEFDAAAQFVLIGSEDKNAYVFRTDSSQGVAVLAGHTAEVNDAAFSPNARRVVTAGEDSTARIWDPGAADQLRFVRRVNGPVTAVFDGEGKIVVRPLRPNPRLIARSPDGSLRASASGSDVVVSNARTGERIRTLHHEPAVTDVDFSPNGKLLATGSSHGTARIWNLRSRPFRQLAAHNGPVTVSFSRDGRWLVTGGPKTAIVWRVSTGERLSPNFYLRGHKGKFGGRDAHLTSAEFSPDGRRIVTASLDGTVRVYDCEVCGGLDSLLQLAQRRLARISRR